MKDQKIQELLDSLFGKKITKQHYDGVKYETEAIDKESRTIVEEIIRKFLNDNRDETLGILEAKVFMYESIISKSTFAPMLNDPINKLSSKFYRIDFGGNVAAKIKCENNNISVEAAIDGGGNTIDLDNIKFEETK